MSLSTLKESSGELADCPICFVTMGEPKCLPRCGHSVCSECAKALEESPGPSRHGVRVKCPICRRISNVPTNGLPTNFALKDLVEKINQLEVLGEEAKKTQRTAPVDKRAGQKKPIGSRLKAQSSTGKWQAGSQSRRQQATLRANTQSQVQGTSRESSSTSSSSSSESISSDGFGGVDFRYSQWFTPQMPSQPLRYAAAPQRMDLSGLNFTDMNSLLDEIQLEMTPSQELQRELLNAYYQSSISYGKKQKKDKDKDKCLIS